jgi:thymidylate kinase
VAVAAPPEWPAERFIESASSGDWRALEALGPRLARRWARRDRAGVVWHVVRASLQSLAEKPAVWRHRRGLSAALLGPDGTGKSTIAREVAAGFCFPSTTVYMGLWPGDGDARRSAPRLALRALARPLCVWLRYLRARAHQLAGRTVIFDRYTYDAWLPPRPPYVRAKRLYFSMVARLCPAPDVILLLDAPVETILARKRDETPAEIAWQRDHFRRLSRRLPELQVIDTARPRREVTAEAIDRIWAQYLARWGTSA